MRENPGARLVTAVMTALLLSRWEPEPSENRSNHFLEDVALL
jgi:hypothetical protein